MKTKIDFVIAGAQKSGTTAVKNFMMNFPEFVFHAPEEFTYFVLPSERKRDIKKVFKENYHDLSQQDKMLCAKNVSLMLEDEALKSLKEHNANCKILVVLRNPVYRAYSAWLYCVRCGWETEKIFINALHKKRESYGSEIEKRNCDYLLQGNYYEHLMRLTKFFPEKNIKILPFEMLKISPHEFYANLFEFLEVDVDVMDSVNNKVDKNKAAIPRVTWISSSLRKKMPGSVVFKNFLPDYFVRKIKEFKLKILKLNEVESSKQKILDKDKEFLGKYYQELNVKLADRFGFDLRWWS